MGDFLVLMFLQVLPEMWDAGRSGDVSRWFLTLTFIASLVLPIFAIGAAEPLPRALLWFATVLALLGLFGGIFVGHRAIRRREKSPGASPPQG